MSVLVSKCTNGKADAFSDRLFVCANCGFGSKTIYDLVHHKCNCKVVVREK